MMPSNSGCRHWPLALSLAVDGIEVTLASMLTVDEVAARYVGVARYGSESAIAEALRIAE
jgi:hypothetical protein